MRRSRRFLRLFVHGVPRTRQNQKTTLPGTRVEAMRRRMSKKTTLPTTKCEAMPRRKNQKTTLPKTRCEAMPRQDMQERPAVSGPPPALYETPLGKCLYCAKRLKAQRSRPYVALLYQMDRVEIVHHCRKRCKECGRSFLYNFVWCNGKKVNSVRIADIDALFVSTCVGFSIQFLVYHIRLHFRGFVSSAAVQWAASGCIGDQHVHPKRWCVHFMNAKILCIAMEEFERMSGGRYLHRIVIGEDLPVDALLDYDRHMHETEFPPADAHEVFFAAMDGHEKVLVRVCGRNLVRARRAGRPRNDGCEKKEHTHGWFMITDPRNGKVLGVEEQTSPENNAVKIRCIKKMIDHYPNLHTMIHDRNCSVEPQMRRMGLFRQIQHWPTDRWHGGRHRRSCQHAPSNNAFLDALLTGVNTSVSESVFKWFRGYARSFNQMKQDRHWFYVLYFCKLHNRMIDDGTCDHLNGLIPRKRHRTSHYGCF